MCFQALLWLKHRSSQTLIMNCYFSIGCDAAVTLNFHRQRESNPSMFKNRLFNKVALAFRNRKKCTISAENLLITQRAATKMYKKCTFSAINHKKLCARTRKITMFCLNFVTKFMHRLVTIPTIFQAWYFGYGTRDIFEGVCSKLNERIALELDGKSIDLPELEGIVLLNINSWSAGCDLWSGNLTLDLMIYQFLKSALL